MGRGRGFNDGEKAIIIKEIARGRNVSIIAESLGRHVDTVKRFITDPSPRKKTVGVWGTEGSNDTGNSPC